MKKVLFWSFATFVILGSIAGVCLAQTAGTGAISGTITDPSGAAVAGAAISAIDVTTGEKRPAVSSGNGTYLVPLLRPGTYRVEVSRSGFKLSVTEVPVHVTETVTVNLQLAVGSPAETITVSANSELLKTEDSTLGNVVDQREVGSLPLVTRNYSQILGLSPGVSAETFNAGEIGRGGVDSQLVTAGSNYSDNNFQMNGVEINDAGGSGHYTGGVATPNPDTIQEFKVQTSQYDASFGRNAGANVNVVTKAGTNNWHGNLWEYFRNEALNANVFFRNQTGQPRPILRQNQFGFTAGGPIKKDKLLVFGSYQGTRQRNGLDSNCSSSVILPVLTNDRSAAGLAAAVGPTTAFQGVDFAGRPVTAETVGAQALALFNLKLSNGEYLVPNPQTTRPSALNGLLEGFSTFSVACPYTEDQYMTNVDWLQNSKSSFQGRFFLANSEANFTLPLPNGVGNTLPGSPLNNPQNFRNFSLAHTYAFTAQVVNQAEFGYHRTYAGTQQSFPFKWADIGSTVPSFDEAIPVIQTLGGFNIGGNGQTVINELNTYVLQDTLSWIRGRHSIRFGGSVTRAQQKMPTFSFPSIAIFVDYPSLLLGTALVPGGPSLTPYITLDLAGILDRDWRFWDGGLYAQDDIKVTPRLTVNLGLRYDYLGGFGEVNGRNSSVDPALLDPNPPADGTLAGFVVSENYPGTRPAGVVSSGNNLGIYGEGQNSVNPRVGFAWSLPGTNRLVLRGGYGIYRQRTTGQPNLQQLTSQPFGLLRYVQPNYSGADFANPFPPDPGAFPQWVPYSPSTTISPYVSDVHFRTPTFQRYSLSLQAQIARDFVLEVGYAGMHGTHMMLTRGVNQASLASPDHPIRGETTNSVANLQLRVPYQGFSAGSFNQIQSSGFAWYNALQASLRKRFSHGLQFLASYTFTRDLANVYMSTNGPNGGFTYGDQVNPRSGYGPDGFIRPHRFVFSGVYELPGPKDRHSLAGQLLGSWTLAGVATIQSGRRLPILNQTATNVYGVPTDFGQITPGCNIATSGSVTERLNNWINKDCMAPYPVVGDDGVATGFGNSPMGILHGPGQANTDLSLLKQFPLKWPYEGTSIEFRAEFFNAFNQTTFADPDIYVSNTLSYGTITNTVANPRIIQFALKLTF